MIHLRTLQTTPSLSGISFSPFCSFRDCGCGKVTSCEDVFRSLRHSRWPIPATVRFRITTFDKGPFVIAETPQAVCFLLAQRKSSGLQFTPCHEKSSFDSNSA